MSSSKRKLAFPGGKIEMPPPQSLPEPRIELSRTTTITVMQDGTPREFTVSFDELKSGDLLGRGQFGVVNKMYHPLSNITFAVKMIPFDRTDPDAKFMDLEAPKLLGDSCPHLVKFYGALLAEAHLWILSEVMDTSLDRFYAKMFALKEPVPESLISKIAHAVLSAIEHMKSCSLMHRDIKPSNILINATGEIKVCDFGISGKIINSICKSFVGCQLYMPPEKFSPASPSDGYSIKADIWSLGMSLIEISTGSHPFKSASTEYIKLISLITAKESPRLDPTRFSPELCSFVEKCLIQNPDYRSNCTDLLKEKFITTYDAEPVDLELIKRVIHEVKKDKIQP